MLPSDLLLHRHYGETLTPKALPLDQFHLELAAELIQCFQDYRGKTQGELDRELADREGHSPDYKLVRGLVHLLRSSFSEFEVISPLEPIELRQRVFSRSAQQTPSLNNTAALLEQLAFELSQEQEKTVLAQDIRLGLYADLPENRILTQYEPPTPEALIHRYNLSQVQGIFYKATQVVINAHRNDPGEYKLLFRYLKLFQLMAYIEGDADQGFTITVDGPTSLFKANTRYGLSLAKLLPALLHVTRWSLTATLQRKDSYSGQVKTGQYRLSSECNLVSHYPPGKTYDSMLEESFVNRWEKTKTEWKLEREVDLIPIPGSVMIPDFRLVHPDGRVYLLEIVGYWRSEYLRKKFAQVRKADRRDLILAISERLNLEKAGVNTAEVPVPIVWFKDKLNPQAILAVLDPA
ncbi:MAG: DUF790 family protein [Prochlorothrix sp.]|nr:DUF790 family protein [Prochlorothrix sp.]